nr:3-mercaptopyruvate sulfurtransferase [uncultured bacterium]
MKKFFSLGISLMLFSFITSSLYAANPLVDAVWVKNQIGKESVVMLDLRMPASYKKGHVPGAVYTNYSKDGWRVKNYEVIAGMLPPVDQISNLIGSLGIGNQDHGVLIPYGTSSSKMGTATRI